MRDRLVTLSTVFLELENINLQYYLYWIQWVAAVHDAEITDLKDLSNLTLGLTSQLPFPFAIVFGFGPSVLWTVSIRQTASCGYPYQVKLDEGGWDREGCFH